MVAAGVGCLWSWRIRQAKRAREARNAAPVSDTPRTECYVLNPLPPVVAAEFARGLERECAALRAQRDELLAALRTAEAALSNIATDISAGKIMHRDAVGNLRACTAMALQAIAKTEGGQS